MVRMFIFAIISKEFYFLYSHGQQEMHPPATSYSLNVKLFKSSITTVTPVLLEMGSCGNLRKYTGNSCLRKRLAGKLVAIVVI